MSGILSKMNEDITVTRKMPNGTTVTFKSPNGSQMDMRGIMGGMVEGHSPTPVADNIPAQLTAGEFVVNQPAAQKYKGVLNKINNEGRQMLAQGGWSGGQHPFSSQANLNPPVLNKFGGGYFPEGSAGEPSSAAALYEGDYQPPQASQQDRSMNANDALANKTVEWVNKLGIPGTDHGFAVTESAIKEYLTLTPQEMEQVGSLEQFIRYAASEEGLLKDHGPQKFWTGGEVGVGDPEEGDSLPGIKGGQGIKFSGGKWVYGRSGGQVQDWLLTRINDAIQPIVEEGEAALDAEGASLGAPVAAPVVAPQQGPAGGEGEAGKSVSTPVSSQPSESQPLVPAPSLSDEVASEVKGFDLKEAESKNYGWANRAINAEKTIRDLEAGGFNPTGAGVARQDFLNWAIDGVLPGDQKSIDILKTPEAQQYGRAVEAFVAAVLRKDTGAQISPTEYDRVLKEMFPSFGSAPETRKQLSDQRLQALDSFVVGAGEASGQLREKLDALPSEADIKQQKTFTAEDIGGIAGSILGGGGGAAISKSPTGILAGSTAGEQVGSAAGRYIDYLAGWQDFDSGLEALGPDAQDAVDAILTAGTAGLGTKGKQIFNAAKRYAAKKGITATTTKDVAEQALADQFQKYGVGELIKKIPSDVAAKHVGKQPFQHGKGVFFVDNNSGKVVDAFTGRAVGGHKGKNITDAFRKSNPEPKF